MNSSCPRAAMMAISLACLAALAACGGRVENNEPAVQANLEIQPQGIASASPAVGGENKGAQNGYVGSLGAKGGTSVMDPDVLIAEQVKAALASNPDFGAAKVDVHSTDGDVTLRGQAPDPTARDRATEIARSIPKVKAVDNQLTLG